jgi:ribose-phosphate pyrophosphokinase
MLKINGQEFEIKKFPDGTPIIKYQPRTTFNNKVVIEWKYENNEEMIYLYMLINHIRTYFKNQFADDNNVKYHLVMYYIPNARMDRVKEDDECFTLKYFCNFINDLKFDKVYAMDPHSNVSCALINNLIQLPTSKQLMDETISDVNPDILYFPDEGSSKRYGDWFKNIPQTFGIKDRDWETGKINGIIVQNGEMVKGKKVLIIDDISSKGGTFYWSAKKLLELGASEVYLHVTHCENSILDGDLISSNYIKKIYTSDSILTIEHPLINKYILNIQL